MSNANLKESNFLIDFIIAGFSAAVGKTLTAPAERVKLLLQNQFSIQIAGGPYKGITDCLSRLVKHEGVISLWRGNMANVIRYFPNQAMNFAFKGSIKKHITKFDQKKEFWKFAIANLFAGGLAGSMSLTLTHPIDLVRTRLATDNKNKDGVRNFNGYKDCVIKIFQGEGLIGLYRGFIISVGGVFVYRALYFGGYDSLKGNLIKKDTGFILKWTLAQTVTIISGLIVYPLDTVRRRIMIESGKRGELKKYKNSLDCIKKISLEEKFLGFYKGFGANILRTMGSSLVLVLYDEIQRVLGFESTGSAKE
jgi:solute carrier family 25 (adenine nucleotide translocator) protein 4/5/6/31